MTTNNGFLDRAKYTLKQEIRALLSLEKTIEKDFVKVLPILKNRKGRIIITGIGKSAFVGMKISSTLVSLGSSAVFLHPADALHGDTGVVSDGDIILAISYSGQSQEVIKIVKYLKKEFSVKIISITGNTNSQLAKISDAHINIHIKDEGSPLGFAPMASTTASLVVGDMIASSLTIPKNFKQGHFARFHPGGGLSLLMKTVESVMTKGSDVPLVLGKKPLKDALVVMSEKSLGIIGVVDEKKELTGVITDGDIRRFLIEEDFKVDFPVQKLMNKKPKSISKDTTLKEALVMMEKYKITSLFVLSKTKVPVGIIHIHSIIGDNINQ